MINSENYTKIPFYKKLRPCMQEVNFLLKQNIYFLIYKTLIIFELYKIFVLILILLNMQFTYK